MPANAGTRTPAARSIVKLAAVTIAIIAVAAAFLIGKLRDGVLEHAHAETAGLARMILRQAEHTFETADFLLRSVQERMQSNFGLQADLDSAAVHLLLASRVAGHTAVGVLFIVDTDGTIVNSSRDHPTERILVRDRQYFSAFAGGRKSGLILDKPVRSRLTGGWMLNVSRPISDADGRFRGVVVAAIPVPEFERGLQMFGAGTEHPISVYLADGTLVASQPHREAFIGDVPPELTRRSLPAPGEDVRLFDVPSEEGGIFALGRSTRFPVGVGINGDDDEELASWRGAATSITLVAIATSALIIFVAALLIRRMRLEEDLESALTQANERYQHTVEAAMDAIIATDDAQRIVIFNPAAEKMFGIPASRVLGGPLEHLIPERLRSEHRSHVDAFVHAGRYARTMAPNGEIFGLRADGTEFPIESRISRSTVAGKTQLTAVLRDVTERRRGEQKLREMNAQLRDLSAALQNVREQERMRIALELHDELGQQLTGLKLELSWLGNRLKEGRAAPPEQVDAMRRHLDSAIATVRRISTELRPRVLDDLGFKDALAWQAGEFSKKTGLAVELDIDAATIVSDNTLATALFRIVQEALTNVARHAEASRVTIRFEVVDENLVLTIADDGRGIPVDGPATRGIGLLSMRERAAVLGGHFEISNQDGGGTAVTVTLPLDAPNLAGGQA